MAQQGTHKQNSLKPYEESVNSLNKLEQLRLEMKKESDDIINKRKLSSI